MSVSFFVSPILEDAMSRLSTHETELLNRAQEIASCYGLVIERARGEGYIGRALELPKVLARGKTREQCLADLRENVVDAVAAILDLGRIPPRPGEKGLTEQVNIRLSREEKQRAEKLAHEQGFRGLADYVRAVLGKEIRS
jgi:predicted RNase H-like HicB family nuclease